MTTIEFLESQRYKSNTKQKGQLGTLFRIAYLENFPNKEIPDFIEQKEGKRTIKVRNYPDHFKRYMLPIFYTYLRHKFQVTREMIKRGELKPIKRRRKIN